MSDDQPTRPGDHAITAGFAIAEMRAWQHQDRVMVVAYHPNRPEKCLVRYEDMIAPGTIVMARIWVRDGSLQAHRTDQCPTNK